ncbi:MAG: aminopeptidase P N-terminal domain-containing protein [Helicobacteraceae bacterium]|nr:aminopeptidase P N-terminal domain-containing protein [Helicobacteraceae bacterium]
MIEEKEYKQRRDILAKQLPKKSVTIFLSSTNKKRSNDTEYPYRQDSNFYYLTGFKEDNAALVFVKKNKSVQTILFVQKKDPTLELWNGIRLGKKEAKKVFDVDKVYVSSSLEKRLEEFLEKKQRILYDFDCDNELLSKIKSLAKRCKIHQDVASFVYKMRLLKSPNEIALIQKALEITKEAHHQVMKMRKSEKYEYQVQAEIEYTFKKNGAYSDAYTTIVASGNNANTLHYIQNDKKLCEGEMILIDAGCEYQYYASDITRTIPVGTKFTKAQKEIYMLVLDVQKKIIQMIRPGVMRSELQTRSEELLCEGMIALGILEGELEELLENKTHKKYYPHGIGHWMGIDVHDQAPYKYDNAQEIPLQKGMVLTIEPALYFHENDTDIPLKYRGIGVRIEDNILVTSKGFKNLSKEIIKEIEDIESYSSEYA